VTTDLIQELSPQGSYALRAPRSYRFWHPLWNITFRGRLEYRIVPRALCVTGWTPRQMLIPWARPMDYEVEPDSTPNPKERRAGFPEGSRGSPDHPKEIGTPSTDKGGNSLTLWG